jgi:UDP-N-acetylmuramyl pentapeptide phosphotransferase/UDP-N-acetylglucosamine-1-phosphate transferase
MPIRGGPPLRLGWIDFVEEHWKGILFIFLAFFFISFIDDYFELSKQLREHNIIHVIYVSPFMRLFQLFIPI